VIQRIDTDADTDTAELTASLRQCLDPVLVRQVFNQLIRWPDKARVTSVGIRRFMPRKKQRFDIEYELRVRSNDGLRARRETLFCRLPKLGMGEPEQHSQAVWTDHGVGGIHIESDQLDATIHSKDHDPHLAQLSECLDPNAMRDRFAAAGLIEHADPADRTEFVCSPVSYRCGRRFVVRYTAANGKDPLHWAGKGYADDRGRQLLDVHRALRDHFSSVTDGHVRVSDAVHYDEDLNMLVTAWAQSSLDRGPGSSSLVKRCRAIADVLAAIHQAPASDLRVINPSEPWEVVCRWNALIETLKPSQADRSQDLVAKLAAVRPQDWSAPTVIHRDFYESQISCSRDHTTVLDLDMLAVGDPCTDLGNHLAHLWLWCLEQKQSFAQFALAARSTLDAYESLSGPVDEQSLSFEWAAALYRVGAIHSFRETTRRFAAPVWDMVTPVLHRGRRSLETVPTRHMRKSLRSGVGIATGGPET